MVYNIADRIRYLRDKSGLTQTDLANKLGISRSAVNSREMSLTSPSLSNLVEMSKIFKVSVDYLVSASDKMLIDISELTTEEQEVFLSWSVVFKRKIRMIHRKNALKIQDVFFYFLNRSFKSSGT